MGRRPRAWMAGAAPGLHEHVRLRELQHTVRTPHSTGSRLPQRQYIDIDFPDAPVDLRWIAFENYYSATVSIHSAEVNASTKKVRWVPVISRWQLMADCHAEDDAQAWHRLHASGFEPGFDPTRVLRLRIHMQQPSPSWRSHTLNHLAFYTLEPIAAPVLAPEPELSGADRERCAKLAGTLAELSRMAHAIRSTLSQAAPQPSGEAGLGALDGYAPFVVGEWDDELTDGATLHVVSSEHG